MKINKRLVNRTNKKFIKEPPKKLTKNDIRQIHRKLKPRKKLKPTSYWRYKIKDRLRRLKKGRYISFRERLMLKKQNRNKKYYYIFLKKKKIMFF